MSKKKLDDFIIEFSNKIQLLKYYEFNDKYKYSKKHYDLFNNLLNILLEKKKIWYKSEFME